MPISSKLYTVTVDFLRIYKKKTKSILQKYCELLGFTVALL
jgi:hypothetical protein